MLLLFGSSTVKASSKVSARLVMNMSRSLPKRLQTRHSLKDPLQLQDEADRVKRFMTFIDKSPEPFHVVQTVSDQLSSLGFTHIDEETIWKTILKKGGKYYYTRNKSSIVAFVIGANYKPGSAFKIIGAHTDSPNLKGRYREKNDTHNFH